MADTKTNTTPAAAAGDGGDACPDQGVVASDKTTYTAQEAIEHIGFGRFHVMLLILCGVGWFAEITELVIMSFVAPQIQTAFDLSPIEYGVLGSSSFIGMAIGAVCWGMVADRFGRWIGFTCTTWITFIFSVASAFAPNYGVLLLFRLLANSGVGGTLPVDYCHLAEFLPTRNRGRHMAIVDGIGVLPGLLFSSLIAYFLSVPDDANSWRWILGVQSIPVGLFALLRFIIPESPRFHLQMGRLDAAERILGKVARWNKKSLPPGKLAPLAGERKSLNPLHRFKELFCTPLMKQTTPRIWLMAFCAQFASAGSAFALPKLLETMLGLDQKRVALDLLLGVVGVPFGLTIAWYCVELSRKYGLTGFYLTSSLGVVMVAVATLSAARNEIWAVVMSMLLRGGMEGMFSILNTIRIEAYPTQNRVTAMGTSQMIYDIGGIIAPLIFGSMSDSKTLSAVALALFAGAYALGTLPTLTLPKGSDYTGRSVKDRHCEMEMEEPSV